MEEKIDPPVVALACGHVLCTDDFKTMGGRIGAVSIEEEEDEEDAEPVVTTRIPRSGQVHSTNSFLDRRAFLNNLNEDDDENMSSWLDRLSESDDEDPSDDDMPPLQASTHQESEDLEEDDGDEPPPLVSRETRIKRSHRYPTRSRTRESNEDESDSDEDMPQLIAR
mmetsp:Transcript_84779/g.127108  ORF Transcript_84779/g.127108 Transcript_84779/m.127108 type:complete len:167 (+) Transcript_84779:53-553(+)